MLVIHRIVKKLDGTYKEYYVVPGGGVEEGETPEQTVVREVKEAMNLDIKVVELVGIEDREKNFDYFYKVEVLGGELKLSGEEYERNNPDNFYEPMYLDLHSLDKINNLFGYEYFKNTLPIVKE